MVTDYEKICSFENLYKAHLAARRSKRHKGDVIKFELNLANNLIMLQKQLEERTFRTEGYYQFVLHEPKRREIHAPYYVDRVLQHCVCDEVLRPVIQPRLIYDNAACQVGKGTHFAMKRLTKFLSEHYKKHGTTGYFLKCDITRYFGSIDHEILKTKLAKVIVDKDVLNLLSHYIDSYHTEGLPGKGLPLGNQSSQWFGIFYMDSLDRMIKEKMQIKYYVRYMDDFILVHHDKEYLKQCLAKIQDCVRDDLKMELNHKTQIFPIKNGAEFLGFRFYLTETGKVIRKMKVQSKLRFKRRLRKMQDDYTNGKIELEEVKSILASYKGHFKHGHTYKLRTKIFSEFVLKRERDEPE